MKPVIVAYLEHVLHYCILFPECIHMHMSCNHYYTLDTCHH